MRAKRLIEQQHPAEAGDLARQALALSHHDAEAWHVLGVVACLENRPDEGQRLVRRAIARRPRNATFHNSLGNAQLASGDIEGARASFRRATDMAPGVVTHWVNLARACTLQQDMDEAVQLLLHAWSLGSAIDRVARPLAAALLARAERRAGTKAAHDRGLAQLYLGFAAAKQRRDDEAAHLFFEAARQAPWLWAAHDASGEVLVRRDDWRGMSRWSRRALVLAPATASAWARLAALRLREDDRVVAGRFVRRALARRPSDSDTLLRLAEVATGLGTDHATLRRCAALAEPDHQHVPRPPRVARAA